MKTIDRKDLRTNELSQQLDQFSVYAKANAARIGIWVGVAIVLAIAVFWFMNYRSNRVADGWAKLGASEKTEPADLIREAREVADADISPALTTQAWLNIGMISMRQTGPIAVATAAPQDWTKTAEEAFNKVLGVAGDDITARGQALMCLGVLAENRGDRDAGKFYKQIVDDRRFDVTPFKAQAEFRLKGVEGWLTPVTIAPAPPPPEPPILGPVLPDVIPVNPPITQSDGDLMPAAAPESPPDGSTTPAPTTPPATTPPDSSSPPSADSDLAPSMPETASDASSPPATNQPAGAP